MSPSVKGIYKIYSHVDLKHKGVRLIDSQDTWVKGKPIQEKYLGKTTTRLNKWDMAKILNNKKWVAIVNSITTLEIIYSIISVGNTQQINYMQYKVKSQWFVSNL